MDAPDPFAPPPTLSCFGYFSGIALVGLLLLIGWCTMVVADEGVIHYRLTVELSTPRGPRSGSSVIEVRAGQTALADNYRALSGEAVAIDLPDGRTLFALLTSADRVEYAQVHVLMTLANRPQPGPRKTPTGSPAMFEEWRRTGAAVEMTDRPTFVTFRDPRDPATIEVVDPDALGAGYALRRITATVTEEPVTRGIESRLPWLADHDGLIQLRAGAAGRLPFLTRADFMKD